MKEELIVKYLVGEAEPHEITLLNNWRNENVENENQFLMLKKLWELSAERIDESTINTDAAWEKVKAKTLQKQPIKVIKWNRQWLVAASVLLVLGVSTLFLFQNSKIEYKEVLIANNTSQNLNLSDGSTLTLKTGSLHYHQLFEGNKRQVKLDSGIAFFNIAKNKDKPFEIDINNTSVIVVGTQFEIHSNTQFTQVKVLEGKVIFKTPNGEKTLSAGMAAIYRQKNKTISAIEYPINNAFSYSTKVLKFESESLLQVVEDLNNYQSDYKIIIENKVIENCKLTSTFKQEELQTILAVIATTFNLQIEKNEQTKTIVLKGGACNE